MYEGVNVWAWCIELNISIFRLFFYAIIFTILSYYLPLVLYNGKMGNRGNGLMGTVKVSLRSTAIGKTNRKQG